jgi:peptide/nickel transport system ATP-binding protein
MSSPLLQVRGLEIAFPGSVAVKRVSFDLHAGESLAIVGESGSGKTLIGKTLLGLLPDAARIAGGEVLYRGRDLLTSSPGEWLEIRGTDIGMVFQEPMVSLNPAYRIGDQLTEALVLRRGLASQEAAAQALAMLERVRVRDAADCMRRYPHEFSGGMRQRIMLAAVMLLKPKLLIADEPTTALDCVVQKEVLDLMLELTAQEGTALIFISHNLALVAAYTQRVLVMRRGDPVETGLVSEVLSRPRQEYTLNLLDALPKRQQETAPFVPGPTVLEVDGLSVDYTVADGWLRKRQVRAVHSTSFSLAAGETLAIVGESGSGKTTISKAILGLAPVSGGSIRFEGQPIVGRERLRAARQRIQMIFQDPYSALDPRMRIADLVMEGLRLDRSIDRLEKRRRVACALDDVGLSGNFGERYVHELSGGQRQRVAIARALVMRPQIVIADEPVSALDVTVQKQVLDLLVSLQKIYGFACLLISHDLGVVEQIAHRVVVMLRGHVVEEGARDAVFDAPHHPYTRRLLQAVPELRGDREHGFRIETRSAPAAVADKAWYNPELHGARQPQLVAVGGAHDAVPHRTAILA